MRGRPCDGEERGDGHRHVKDAGERGGGERAKLE